jgi:hypothetical protein
MANTLTISSLAENIFRARDTVARELVGFIPSVLVNADSEGVSRNGTVTSFRTSEPTLNTSYTPAMTVPAADDQTIAAESLSLGQVANVRIPLTGEDEKKLSNTAGQAVIDAMFAQAIRKMVNAIETHVGSVAYQGASKATGTAGTTPFASNHESINDLRKILVDQGTPMDGQVSLVLNSAAGTKLRNLSHLYKVNEGGSADLLRQGILQDLSGISIRESAGVASHTKGTGSGYLINLGGGYAAGSTALTLDTGSGTIVAGDVVTFAADTVNKYVVGSALASNVVTLNRPGLAVTVADNNALTVGNSYTANVGFHRNAIELAIRPPAQPFGGDAAVDRMTIADDRSPLVFEVALYKGYGMVMFDLTCFYQAKVWKPEFVATLLG